MKRVWRLLDWFFDPEVWVTVVACWSIALLFDVGWWSVLSAFVLFVVSCFYKAVRDVR